MLNFSRLSHPKHRFFFAIQPPPLIARRIAAWAARFGSHGALVHADRLHVTLDILDDLDVLPSGMVGMLIEVGAVVRAGPFMIELDQANGGGGSIALRPRLKNPALQQLAARIAGARVRAGIAGRQGYRFSPHITLLYREGRPFSETVIPFAWEVREFVLIHSLLGQTRHVRLGSWQLTEENVKQFDLFSANEQQK
jgi:2''-5'' RNA ligase